MQQSKIEMTAAGDYLPLKTCLTRTIYRHGRSKSPLELLKCAKCRELANRAWIAVLIE